MVDVRRPSPWPGHGADASDDHHSSLCSYGMKGCEDITAFVVGAARTERPRRFCLAAAVWWAQA
jgi:hypothetical protein